MITETRLFDLFKDLCLINAPALQERECVEFGKRYLKAMGLEVSEDNAGEKIGGNANNVIAKLPGNKPGAPAIFFSAHFDTVEPTEGLEIGERNGEFYSKSDTILGADDKGGMAPAIEAVQAIKESGEPHGDVYLILSVAEEIGLKGAFACDIQQIGVDYGFVFDTGPPVGSFVNHVGTHDKIYARVIGRPAHAGKHPEDGINAIQAASAGVAKMKLGKVDEDTTANVGTIEGGTATNVVPAEANLTAEARSLDVAKLDAQVKHMVDCFEAGAAEHKAKTEIRTERMYDGYLVAEDAAPVRVALKAAANIGFRHALRWTLGGSDANAFNAKGVPSIVVGTGMKEIHTHDEHVSKKDLSDLALLAIELIRVAARG
ncbi:MAG: M20/M25/M40 family metallo-hydrolase [Armatimonadetes bacterium]|nr:M20/M25/M40 family metallo-hydrolase [Armatimonadota bacterium]